jgi:hypothetical protein
MVLKSQGEKKMRAKITFELDLTDLTTKISDEEIIDILKFVLSDNVDVLAVFRENGMVGFRYEIYKFD